MKRFLGILILAALVATPLMAQTRNGNLFLTIMDEQGAVQSGVEVVLTGQDFARTVTSDNEGKARFANLTVGVYELVLRNTGFNTMIMQGIQIDAGANATFDVKMQRSDLVEEVVVTAITPLLDKRNTGTSTIFSKTEIEQVPQARDPWSIISTIPGVTTDRVNVAGSEAGQQANIGGKGDDGDQTVWQMDGVEFTDMAAIGGSASYLDFNSFEQISVVTAGGDFASQSPGVQLDFVTKQGSNRHTGTARFLYTKADLQDENNAGLAQPDWDTSGAPVAGNGVNEIFEKNFDIGGPLLKDKLWYWFGFTQNDIDVQLITGLPDITKLQNTSVKFHGQFLGKGTAKAFYTVGDKIKLGRTGYPATQRPAETRWNQSGPSPIYGVNVSYFFTPDLEVTFQYGRVEGGFQFIPEGIENFDQQIFQDASGVFANTFSTYVTERPQDQYLIKGNYFFDTGSWDHELKFGFRYKDSQTTSFSKYSEADGIFTKYYTSVLDNGQAYLYREINTDVSQEQYNIWVGDTILKGPWTINAGLHYSNQTGKQNPSIAAANGTAPDLFQGTDFPGFDPGVTWSDVAPRLGVTYTFDWEKRLLLRAGAGQYFDQLSNNIVSYNLPLGFTQVIYDWDDANNNDILDWDPTTSTGEIVDVNGDGVVDCNDASFARGIDACNTSSATSPDKIDSNLSAPKVTEFNLGADWELAKDFTIGATYTYRDRDNIVWTPYYNGAVYDNGNGSLQTAAGSAIYDCTNTDVGTAPDGTFEWDEHYCTLTQDALDNILTPELARWETNMPGYSQVWNSFELSATKRLSNRWMMRAFVAFTDWKHEFSGEAVNPGIYGRRTADGNGLSGDLTNFRGGSSTDSGLIAVQSTASGGKGDVFYGSSQFQFNANGLYQLPKGWSISGNLYYRQGYGLANYTAVSTANEGGKNVQIRDVDTDRYDDLLMLDLRIAKLFTLGGNTNVELAGEVFNVTNENTTIQLGQNASSTAWQRINEIVSPRVLRFVATVNF